MERAPRVIVPLSVARIERTSLVAAHAVGLRVSRHPRSSLARIGVAVDASAVRSA
jgi:hypothetical protein